MVDESEEDEKNPHAAAKQQLEEQSELARKKTKKETMFEKIFRRIREMEQNVNSKNFQMSRRCDKIEKNLESHRRVHEEHEENIDRVMSQLKDLRAELEVLSTNFKE